MKKKTTKEFEMTPRLTVLNKKIYYLSDAIDKVCKPSFFRKVNTKAISELADLKAKAFASFWAEVHMVYPETRNGDWSANDVSIKEVK